MVQTPRKTECLNKCCQCGAHGERLAAIEQKLNTIIETLGTLKPNAATQSVAIESMVSPSSETAVKESRAGSPLITQKLFMSVVGSADGDEKDFVNPFKKAGMKIMKQNRGIKAMNSRNPKTMHKKLSSSMSRSLSFSSFDDAEADEDDGGCFSSLFHGEKPRVVAIVEKSDGMFNPRSVIRMAWDLAVVMPLLVYLAIVLPFRLSFANEPIQYTAVYWFEFMIDMVFIFDIFMNFRTGYPLKIGGGTANDDAKVPTEYDKWSVAKRYAKGWLFIDIFSGVPFPLIELIMEHTNGGSGGDTDKFKSAKALKLLRFLKLARLLKIDKILKSLDRDTLDTIEDFLQKGGTRSAVVMLRLVFVMAISCHLMSCGFVMVGRAGSEAYIPCWFDYEGNEYETETGPFLASDTTGGPKVISIYLGAFYFCLTTMISVGYGDIIAHNNMERLYVMVLEFIAAIVFATVIAAITSVVTSMDMNARKVAEQLDAVASFVELRQFPDEMARRIRRHFRHFYTFKAAIDETKIFSELSTTLRAEVSEYLINDLIGNDSIFMNMSPNLWPRLLPLLRPMRFEEDETVCQQDDESTDMYVVLHGRLAAVTVIAGEPEPQERRVTTGGNVNVLHVLGVWNFCIETVYAEKVTETYAVSAQDFQGLFNAKNDKAAFDLMLHGECRKFEFDKDSPAAPTPFGRPLYLSCFWPLEVVVLRLEMPLDLFGSTSSKNSLGSPFSAAPSDSSVMVIFDLCDMLSGGDPFNDIWLHKTENVRQRGKGSVKEGGGGPKVFRWNANQKNRFKWADITTTFSSSALRVRVVATSGRGKTMLLATTVVPLVDIEERMKQVGRAEFTAALLRNSRKPLHTPGKASGASLHVSGGRGGGGEMAEKKKTMWLDLDINPVLLAEASPSGGQGGSWSPSGALASVAKQSFSETKASWGGGSSGSVARVTPIPEPVSPVSPVSPDAGGVDGAVFRIELSIMCQRPQSRTKSGKRLWSSLRENVRASLNERRGSLNEEKRRRESGVTGAASSWTSLVSEAQQKSA